MSNTLNTVLQDIAFNFFRMTTKLTLDELKTELVSDAAETCGFKSTRQFLDVWKAAGFRTLRPSPRKRVVLLPTSPDFYASALSRLHNKRKTMSENIRYHAQQR
ncbi:MAG TPA: hypothetical protein VFI94_10195 [Pseudolabrys sp.]|nr:hypothetical protein [Pseudolabrys sp.]